MGQQETLLADTLEIKNSLIKNTYLCIKGAADKKQKGHQGNL